jgi:acyl carrier protein
MPAANDDNDAKLKRTLADVLGIPEAEIGDDTSMDTVAAWDSLKHLNLVLAVEDRFGVSLTEEQSFEILSYPLLKAVLQEHGIGFAA